MYCVIPLLAFVAGAWNVAISGETNKKQSGAHVDQIDKTALAGHLQPIGNQGLVKRGQIEEVEMMISGSAFYHNYWLPGKPVVFRGVLKNTEMMQNWINETYMKQYYGSVRGSVDRRTKWERGGVEPPPRSIMNYTEFLDRLPHEELYWDDAIPPEHSILNDVPMPLALNCESTRGLFQYINLMVNSGNVSYVLHSDFADNLFHFLAGEKTWLIANSTYRDSAYLGQKTQSADLSPVAPDAVDLIAYPRISEIEFHEVKLHPGDIFYVPRDWPHHVRSSGTPNIAMNIWFGGAEVMSHLPEDLICKLQLRAAKKIL